MTPETGPRLPVSVIGSVAFHAAALAFLMLVHTSKTETTHVVSNVDLMIQVHKAVALPKAMPRATTPPSTWNFLKMALPQAPKLSMQTLDMKVPEHRVLMQAQPKLQDRGRYHAGPQLKALDMSAHHTSLASIAESGAEMHHLSKLASLPALEEVGRRRIRNLPAAIKLDDERRQATALQGLGAMGQIEPSRRAPAPVGQALQDAGSAPPSSGFASRIASMLPSSSGIDMSRRAAPVGIPKQVIAQPVARKRRAAQALIGDDKKGVTIEGPLQDRKVLSYDIPEFPKWARDQGVLEASVAIRFWVDHAGTVMDNMRIEHTSGYGQLDRLAMDSLRNWRFAPIPSEERQWGVITFRFVLE